jgi:hypothetical protein
MLNSDKYCPSGIGVFHPVSAQATVSGRILDSMTLNPMECARIAFQTGAQEIGID